MSRQEYEERIFHARKEIEKVMYGLEEDGEQALSKRAETIFKKLLSLEWHIEQMD